jgi:transglutaminase-like putative cysteine protease
MNFEKLFRILSYGTVFCGFFALWISGTFGLFGTGLFIAAMIAAWFLEGSRWQISERLGTALIVLAVPAYYVLWRIGFFSFANAESMLPGILARLILSLSAIKLLQRKSDRDWIFLYIMAFFQVLLAAGLSISALYLFAFVSFVFFMVCTIILFEMRKTNRTVAEHASVKCEDTESDLALPGIGRIPATAIALIAIIIVIATPMFFLIPRVGGAGIGSDPGGVSTRSGFSDTVKLGGIGSIQQNDEVVMRVRIEGADTTGKIKWRGVALDTFDGKAWSKSRPNMKEPRAKGDRDLIQVDYASGRESLLIQTIYLEPLDTPVLFAAPRAVGVQGNFSILMKDAYGGISFQRSGERISYKVLSDTSLPPDSKLRADNEAYPVQFGNYLQLPDQFDHRIRELSKSIFHEHQNRRYDAALAVEKYLQTQFGYTLEQKAGGDDPLADFLFNVREGHCEYFATAMAMMLRSQGVATRIVNGFQQGEYNETADIFVVRQRHAHAWVEVYFPGEEAWVPFDPTPFAGQGTGGSAAGITSQLGKYLEALEMFWIQYFVAFDNQEQRSLFTSVKRSFVDYQNKTSSYVDTLQAMIAEWWKDVRGEKGFETSVAAIGYAVAGLAGVALGIIGLVWLFRRIKKLGIWTRLAGWLRPKPGGSIVEFYERMQRLLAARGFVREPYQTPLEFAYAVNMPEAVKVTEKYNGVRFGERALSNNEEREIEKWLEDLNVENETN